MIEEQLELQKLEPVEFHLRHSRDPWVKVELLSRITGLTRREIRGISESAGFAYGNKGLALMERISPEEQLHAYRRLRSQLLSHARRLKKMKTKMYMAGTLPLKGVS